MNPTEIPLMFYVSGAKKSFERYNDKILEKLAKEISSISLTIDISQPIGAYTNKQLKIALERAKDWNDNKPLEMIKFTGDQRFSIEIEGDIVKKDVSCMQLMAIMTYCVDKIKGGQLKEMAGFDYLKMGSAL